MNEPLLQPPDRWSDELLTLVVDSLALSGHRLTERIPAGRTLVEIEDDLTQGAWLVRVRDKGSDFIISGSQFELRVRSRSAKVARHPIAQVLGVFEAQSVPRRAGRLMPGQVVFRDLWDEAWCDLDALAVELERRLRLTNDTCGRLAAQPELDLHQELQRSIRREYGDLNTLIGLLEQRPLAAERSVPGVVTGRGKRGRDQFLVVETGADSLDEFRGKRVSLRRPDGRAANTRVIRVQARELHVAEPQDWLDAPDGAVEVSEIARFGMQRNAQALQSLLSGQVEGAWSDLARMLSRPETLVASPFPPLRTFYCDSDPEAHPLDDEQRRAVTGAVMSPHAFLVQGPPGTGKTEVIVETIQQLVGQGQRVLLLAPAHVAVDEVLSRVGPKPGMRPLRITFDDGKVDERVRAYLPQNVGVELADQVMRPTGVDRTQRWAAELVDVERRLAALTAAQSAAARLTAAREPLRKAEASAKVAATRLSDHLIRSDRERARTAAAVTAAEHRLAGLTVAARDAATAVESLRAAWEQPLAETARAAHELSMAAQLETGWGLRADGATQEFETRWQAHVELVARHDQAINQLTAQVATEWQALAAAGDAEWRSAGELGRAEAAAGRLAQLGDRIGVGQVAQARRAVADARAAVARSQHGLRTTEAALGSARWHRDEVAGQGWRWLTDLRNAADHDREQAAAAAAGRARALHRFLDVVAGSDGAPNQVGAPVHPDLTGDHASDACGWLAAAVLRIVDAVSSSARVPGPHLHAEASAFDGLLAAFVEKVDEAWHAESARSDALRARHEAEALLSTRTAERELVADAAAATWRRLDAEERKAQTEHDRLRDEEGRLRAGFATATGELQALGLAHSPEEAARLRQRRLVLPHLPAMEHRWRELVGTRTDEQLVDDIQTSALRATNLVCATTTGIVGRGSDVVRHTDYDTLIVDEASRVTDSEFLIGAVRARRWVLVGDEHQLPPHVDQGDEQFLHALFALYRHYRGAAATVDQAVDDLAGYWREDIELREFRRDAVCGWAAELADGGLWETSLRPRMAEAYEWFAKRTRRHAADDDPDRVLLRAMDQYLVRSLFERVVEVCAGELRQRLEWQRRMPEPLAEIVNGPVYDGNYKSPSDAKLAAAGAVPLLVPDTFARPVVFLDTSRYRNARDRLARQGHGFENELERRMVLDACRVYHDELDRTRSRPVTVSILSFYRAQARALDDALDRRSFPLFDIKRIDTIDSIQGQQSDLVMISFVRARERGAIGAGFGSWLQDLRRLNVACTRARRALVLVGHADTLRHLGTNRDGTPRDADAVPAVNFYRNLFDLLDHSPGFLMMHKFGSDATG